MVKSIVPELSFLVVEALVGTPSAIYGLDKMVGSNLSKYIVEYIPNAIEPYLQSFPGMIFLGGLALAVGAYIFIDYQIYKFKEGGYHYIPDIKPTERRRTWYFPEYLKQKFFSGLLKPGLFDKVEKD